MWKFKYTFFFFLLPYVIHAQYKFDKAVYIGPKDGLPTSSVYAIAQDEDGFMWLGTLNGLCRYDGTNVKIFRPDESMLLPISDFIINCLLISGDTIWVGHYAGLVLFNRATEKFQDFPFEKGGLNKGTNKVQSIIKDKNGDLWLGVVYKGIVRLDVSSREYTTYTYSAEKDANDLFAARLKEVFDIAQDIRFDSILWAATQVGLLQLDKKSGKVKGHYRIFPDKSRETEFNQLHLLHQEPDGKLFLGTYFDGVNVFDPETGMFSDLPVAGDMHADIFLNSHIRDIRNSGNDHLWITTNSGLLQYDINSQRFVRAWKNSGDKYGITYVDESGRIWYARNPGVFLYDPLLQQFEYSRFRTMPGKTGSIPRKILEDEKTGDLLLIAQFAESIMHLDRSSGQWTQIPLPEGFLLQEDYFHGWGIIKNDDQSFLVLEENYGLFSYQPDHSHLWRHPLQPETNYHTFRTIIRDRHDRIWIGSHLDGLLRLDPQIQKFTYFKEELEHPELDALLTNIWYLFIDSRDNMWIKRHLGYSVYLEARDTFINFLYPANNQNPIHIENFAEDRNGRIWMAGGGAPFLYYADVNHPEKGVLGKIRVFPEAEIKIWVMYIEADHKGNIWAITSWGLARLDPDDLSIQRFGYDYGMHSLDLYMKCLSTGEMVISHRDAISFFWPDSLQINTELPKPYITRFKIFDKDLWKDSSLLSLSNIDLSYKQNFFSIEYAAVAYSCSDQVSYRYKLESFDQDWIDAGKRKYAAYTNVPAGNYTFLVKAINSEGLESQTPFKMHIRIIPPWWKTPWANLIFAMVLVGGFYFFYHFQLNRKLERAETRRLKELDAVKTKLYTNITHEFRTPLSVILGMADQIKGQVGESAKKGLQVIRRNGRQLLELVNQMLDLRKLESGTMPVNLIQGDILLYFKYILESFHSYAESKDICLHFLTDLTELNMDYDPEKILTILSNLLSNAIKFTPAGGDVYLQLAVSSGQSAGGHLPTPLHFVLDGQAANWKLPTDPCLLLTVRDTGIGIPTDKLPHIFDRFYQVDDESTRKAEGTGIGLTLTKELVYLLEGEIDVKSEVGEGTTFSIWLPIRRTAPVLEGLPAVEQPLEMAATGVAEILAASEPPVTAGADELPLVLIIEDNKDVAHYLRSCLSQRDALGETGYRLETTYNGQEGIDKAIKLVPDLIISDVMMPLKDGFEVCDVLKNDERTSHIPIILLTAKADVQSRLAGLKRGADAYLAKPFNKEELLVRMAALIGQRRKLQAYYLSQALEGEAPASAREVDEELTTENTFVQKIREIIETHLDDPDFSVEQLSREAALSQAQLFRKLKALIGKSAVELIRSIRLAKARELLKDPRLSITAVAFDTGFNDPLYFSRVFRKEFGMSPSEFREGE